MVRHTTYHGWTVPESGDAPPSEVVRQIDELFDRIDHQVPLRGTSSEQPDAGDRGRLFLDISNGNEPVMRWDRGDSWRNVAGEYQIPETITRSDRDEVIEAQWSSEVTQDMDISGSASSADDAEHANTADEALDFVDYNVDSFLQPDADETVENSWDWSSRQTFNGGINVRGGGGATIDLPQYEGSDPAVSDRVLGSMWWRDDYQPSN